MAMIYHYQDSYRSFKIEIKKAGKILSCRGPFMSDILLLSVHFNWT